MRETTLKKETIFTGKIVKLEKHRVNVGAGKEGIREIVRHPGAAAVLVLDSDYVYLVSQYRKALERETLEIPAGTLEKGEYPDDCARREVKEELKISSHNLEHLTTFNPSPGYLDEVVHLYLATDLYEDYADQDEDEVLELKKLSITEVIEKIKSGEITDGKTVIALLYYLQFYCS